MYRRSSPKELGYHDKYVLFDSDSSHPIDSGKCGTNPNPLRKSDNKPWDSAFAQIASGTYPFTYGSTPKHKQCLLVKNGGQVPTTNGNVNHDWNHYATSILVHNGDNQHNRGSKGCCTIEPSQWNDFISKFKKGDKGMLTITTDSTTPQANNLNVSNSAVKDSQQAVVTAKTPTIGDIFSNNLAKIGHSIKNMYKNKTSVPTIGNIFLDNLKHPGYSLDDIKNSKAKISFFPY